MKQEIILCSGSPRRRELLKLLVPSFRVLTSDADETFVCADPDQFARQIALRKAKAVLDRLDKNQSATEKEKEASQERAAGQENSLLIGADTSVWLNGHMYGKPKDRADAEEMIASLSGRTHTVVTGVAVLLGEKQVTFAETTKVHVLPMSQNEIKAYCNTDEPYDKAGGYGIQGLFSRYISGIDGDYFNVVGLPVSHLWRVLKELGADK